MASKVSGLADDDRRDGEGEDGKKEQAGDNPKPIVAVVLPTKSLRQSWVTTKEPDAGQATLFSRLPFLVIAHCGGAQSRHRTINTP